jgi:hypothetical protein
LLLAGDELSVTDLAKRAGLAYPTAHREVERLVDAAIPPTSFLRQAAGGQRTLVDHVRTWFQLRRYCS